MKDEIIWTVTEPSGKIISEREPLTYREEIEIVDKMPKGQIPFAEGWNAMRARLILLGEMKSK